ncbi:hypothetical protein BGZ98_003035, partial [Dissophora globulifera]
SLALEGIDSARQWPSMSETTRRPSKSNSGTGSNMYKDSSSSSSKNNNNNSNSNNNKPSGARVRHIEGHAPQDKRQHGGMMAGVVRPTIANATSTLTTTTTTTTTAAAAAAAASMSLLTSVAMPRASRVKESITKDSAPRKWICRQVPVKTLGGEMMMPIWFSGRERGVGIGISGKDMKEKTLKISRDRSESRLSSTRDSTPSTPMDASMPELGTPPPRQRRGGGGGDPLATSPGARPRPFVCQIEDCGKRFVDALQLERHVERHGPKELECDLDKLFSSLMLLRRHQSMVHKRRSEKWESPPGTARQRAGRSRRREPRIVASGDVIPPEELERQPRASTEVDPSGDDYGDDDDGDDEESSTPRPMVKELKPLKEPKASKQQLFQEPPKSLMQPPLQEHKPLQGQSPKKLAPRSRQDQDADAPPEERSESKPRPAGSFEDNPFKMAAAFPGPRPRPFHCTYDDCKKVFIDAVQLERHLERHGPKELECGIDGCRKRFSAQMLLRRHQSMVHKRRSPAVPVAAPVVARYLKTTTTTTAGPGVAVTSGQPSFDPVHHASPLRDSDMSAAGPSPGAPVQHQT